MRIKHLDFPVNVFFLHFICPLQRLKKKKDKIDGNSLLLCPCSFTHLENCVTPFFRELLKLLYIKNLIEILKKKTKLDFKIFTFEKRKRHSFVTLKAISFNFLEHYFLLSSLIVKYLNKTF